VNIQSRVFVQFLSGILTFWMPAVFTFLVADDTEIYFSGTGTAGDKPKVLFVLDTSDSMAYKVPRDEDGDGNLDDDGNGDIIDPTDPSRIEVLGNAMENLLTSLDNVRVGIMRMNGAQEPSSGGTSLACGLPMQRAANGETYDRRMRDTSHQGNTGRTSANSRNACYIPTGGTVLFPVADLDESVAGMSGGTPTVSSILVPISESNDDVAHIPGENIQFNNRLLQIAHQQCGAGTASYQSEVLTIADDADDVGQRPGQSLLEEVDVGGIGELFTGFRFQNLSQIPIGAYIEEAYMVFLSEGAQTDAVSVTIYGDISNNHNPPPYTPANGPQNRINGNPNNLASARVNWSDIVSVADNVGFRSPDITPIIQEIVRSGNWTPSRPISLLMDIDSGGGNRNIADRPSGGPPLGAAQLIVSYCVPGSPEDADIGLRFQNVRIPQGATITDADIVFTAGNQPTNPGFGNLRIWVDVNGNADPFSAAVPPGHVSRGLAISAQWPMPNLVGDRYITPSLTSLVQAVVNNPGDWCGGNDMAFVITGDAGSDLVRVVSSYDDDPARAPVLRVTYDTSGISGSDTGCNKVDYNIPVGSRFHDAEQRQNNSVLVSSGTFNLGNASEYGLIFSLPVEQGITVDEALLQFTVNQVNNNGPADFFVNAQNTGNAPDFSTMSDDIGSGRPRVRGGNGDNVEEVPRRTSVVVDDEFTLDVTSLVQDVIYRSDWTRDNQVALFVRGDNGIRRRVHSYDGDAVKAPRLLLRVEEEQSTLSTTTVRRRLLEINDSIDISSLLVWTPSVETLYESALYWRGKGVHFGRQRGAARLGTLTVPLHNGSMEIIDYTDSMHKTVTSHPDSWTGGTYDGGVGGTNCQFSNAPNCAQDQITGNPVYTSPISVDECASNYTIFLTDGAPTLTNQDTEDRIIAEFPEISACEANDPSINAQDQNGRCAVEMARAMANNDQDGDATNGEQTVRTYTVAFNLQDNDATNWLAQIANAGGGQFYNASDASQLANVFDRIFGEVLSSSTTFSSPAITTNFFNRTRSRDEIYFGLFTPKLEKRWDGNVKRFRVCVDDNTIDPVSGQSCTAAQVEETAILDQRGNDAVDPATLLFVDSSESYWSSGPDGSSTVAGGAGAEVTDYTARTFYTDEDSSGFPSTLPVALNVTGFTFDSTNWNSTDIDHVRALVCNDPTLLNPGDECYNKMLWLLGRDITDEDSDGDTIETRWGMGDIVHASPVVITYGFSDTVVANGQVDPGESLIDKLIVNTNDGGMRMVNPDDGTEDWVFMPTATLLNVGELYDNDQGQHLYGLDATPVLHQMDVNNDGIITPSEGDFVRIYQVMRRGGRFVYALDLTPTAPLSASSDPITPKLLWRIQGGTGDYTRMGDTWSRPVLATINVRDNFGDLSPKDVLIMGGGYDNDLDNNFGTSNANPNLGNALYIIDPDNGEKLLSISHAPSGGIASSGADIQVRTPLFRNSITAGISVLNSDGDLGNIDDRLYFPDTGGNVWRVDLGDDILADGSGLYTGPLAAGENKTIIGRVAALSGNMPAGERRFYHDLTAVQVIDTEYTDTTTATDNNEGRLTYLLMSSGYRAHPLDGVVEDRFYALRDKVIGHLMDNQGNDRLADGVGFRFPIQEAGLESVTTQTLDDSTRNAASQARVRRARGWYLDFPDRGEKGLSTITVLRGQVFFTTYVPADMSMPGSNMRCSADIGESFGYSISLATGGAVIDWDQLGGLDITDRRRYLGAGLTSDPLPIFTDAGVKIITGLQQSVQALSGFFSSNERTYWYQDN